MTKNGFGALEGFVSCSFCNAMQVIFFWATVPSSGAASPTPKVFKEIQQMFFFEPNSQRLFLCKANFPPILLQSESMAFFLHFLCQRVFEHLEGSRGGCSWFEVDVLLHKLPSPKVAFSLSRTLTFLVTAHILNLKHG
eukprot:EG_transcript_19522